MNIIHVQPGHLAEAIAQLPPDDGTPVTLKLAAGEYREKCVLSRANTILAGEGAQNTRIVWNDGAFTILPDGMKRGTFRTATLLVDAPHVKIQHLTIENDAVPRSEVGQALALYVDADDFACENCRLIGYQDTLFTAPLPPKEVELNGFIGPKQHAPRIPQRHVYRNCYIQGNVDLTDKKAVETADRKRFEFVNKIVAQVETRKVFTKDNALEYKDSYKNLENDHSILS